MTDSSEAKRLYFGRGLNADELDEIFKLVRDTSELQGRVVEWSPTFMAMGFPPGSNVPDLPNAAVCFQDMVWALGEAEYALRQGLVALAVFRQKVSVEPLAVTQASFYQSDVASRLYAAGEHVAAGICDTIGVSERDLDLGKKEKRVSRQSKLAGYLRAKFDGKHPLVLAGEKLAGNPEWFSVTGYRAQAVHAQPPTLAGVGITYRRGQKRWHEVKRPDGSVKAHVLSVGGGDPPAATIDDLLRDASIALTAFCDYATSVLDYFETEVERHRSDAIGQRRGLEFNPGDESQPG